MPSILRTYRPMDEHTCRAVVGGAEDQVKAQKAAARQAFRQRMDAAFLRKEGELTVALYTGDVDAMYELWAGAVQAASPGAPAGACVCGASR